VQARVNRQLQPSPSAKRRRSAARITSCGTSRGSATMASPAAFPAATATGSGLGRRRHRAPLVSGWRNLPATKTGIPQRRAPRLQCAMPAAGRGVELEADCAPVGRYGGCGAAGGGIFRRGISCWGLRGATGKGQSTRPQPARAAAGCCRALRAAPNRAGLGEPVPWRYAPDERRGAHRAPGCAARELFFNRA